MLKETGTDNFGLKPLSLKKTIDTIDEITKPIMLTLDRVNGTISNHIGAETLLNNRNIDIKKEGEILPLCAVTHRYEPGEFREYLLQQTTLSQAAESCQSRRKVQRIDGEKGINNPSTSSRHPNCILHYNTP